MKENFRLKEQINHKVISMIDLAIEDIFQPNSEYQSGEKSVNAGFFDKHNNRFDLTINLSVTSGAPVEEPEPDEMAEIVARLEKLEKYHTSEVESPDTNTSTSYTEPIDSNTSEENNGSP